MLQLGEMLLVFSGEMPRMLLNILHRTVPTTNNYPVQNVNSAEIEKPCSTA